MIKKLSLITAFCTVAASSQAANLTQKEYTKQFNEYNACFILYDVNAHKTVAEYNPSNRCNQRIPSNSTFKIAIALIAFDQGLISESTEFKQTWPNNPNIPSWNHDQTTKTWMANSIVPISQQITTKIGLTKMQHYMAGFAYGNQDFSGDSGKNNGITNAWLSSSLKISAVEELAFLQAMLNYDLPVSNSAVNQTKVILSSAQLKNGLIHRGKTGSGWKNRQADGNNTGHERDGWYVGYVESGNNQYIFVTNLTDKAKPATDKSLFGGEDAKKATVSLLNSYFN
jgi:beta-lactamase class D/beta-lactamase class D OXA-1